MYTHILVPLDGSELAEQVLPHVQELAEKFDSKISLLRVIVPSTAAIATATPMGLPMTQPIDPYAVGDLAETLEIERQAAEDYLKSVAERLGIAEPRLTHEVREGPLASTILERANTIGANLIAMTTHGRGGLERVILGSVADEVIRKSTCPILLVRVSEAKSHG